MARPLSARTLLDRLGTSPFVTEVFGEASRVYRAAFIQGEEWKTDVTPTRKLTEAEHHATASGFAVAHYLGVLRQLVHLPGYLKQYRRTSALVSRGVTRASDLTYHLEGFLVRVEMLKDRAYQLCSAVCHTGLGLNAVNERAILRNRIVRSVGLDGPLKELKSICQPYKLSRNEVVHTHGLLDEDIRRAEFFLLARPSLPKHLRVRAATSYRSLVKSAAEEKARELDAFVRAALETSIGLFELLHPQFQLRQNQLEFDA